MGQQFFLGYRIAAENYDTYTDTGFIANIAPLTKHFVSACKP
jgi:hypothetical protein